jgi:hypothetical protein
VDRTRTIVSAVFALVGGAALLGAGYSALETESFLKTAIKTTGEVIALDETRTSDNGVVYQPVFRFTTRDGREVVFRSSTASSPPAYGLGEKAELAYPESAPESARALATSSLWFDTLLLGFFGVVFGGIGGGMLVAGGVEAAQRVRLQREGRRVGTSFQRVELNTSVSVNDAHPWRIVTQWQNPETGHVHLFHSDDIWFNPSEYVSGACVIVYVDPRNPKKYYMDITFLPKLA